MWYAAASAVAAVVVLAAATVRGVELDWGDQAPWTDTTGPTYVQTYTIGTTTIDVTVSDPDGITPSGSPTINTQLTGGLPNDFHNLFLQQDVDFQANLPNYYTTIELEFSEIINNVEFSLFDVDFSGTSGTGNKWRDIMIVRGVTSGSSFVDPTGIITSANNIVPSSTNVNQINTYFTDVDYATTSNTVVGTGGNVAENSSDGNATFQFSQNIVAIQIDYLNGYQAASSAGYNQWIGLHDITYDVVPEPTAIHLLALLLSGALLRRRRRAGC